MDEKELARQVYNNVKTGILRKYRWPVFTLIMLLLLMIVAAGYFWHKHGQSEEARLQQAKVLSEQYARDVNALQNELKMSKQNAEMLANYVARAQAGQVQPVTNFTVQAPNLPQAVQQVAERINNNDPTLPPAVLEKTDRTMVAPNIEQQKVDIYKIDLRKDHRIKAGVTIADGEAYGAVGYEQGRFEAIAHVRGKDIKGATVMYNIIEW